MPNNMAKKLVNTDIKLGSGTILPEALINIIYPIGSIFMSVSPINPSTIMGGTWVAWGSGRVPVGVDTSQTDFNTVQKTGGSKTEILSIYQLPNTIWQSEYAGGTGALNLHFNGGSSSGINGLGTGKNQPHNNLQPYITCYMWRRTG